jgi:hypothetical protein
MVGSTREAIRLGLGFPRLGVNVEVVSNGQSLKATFTAMAANYYWVLWRKAANANGTTSVDVCTGEA